MILSCKLLVLLTQIDERRTRWWRSPLILPRHMRAMP